MIKYSNQQYNQVFYKLPQEIRDVVASSDTTEHLYKIGQKRSLHIDKMGVMVDITLDVMMGIIASKNFAEELQTELGLDALEASALARDIDENIFKPIKKQMLALYGDGAPNKPGSSLVTFTEEEDDHKALDKDTLLKEIESPAPVQPKKEEVVVTIKTPEKPTTSKAVELYHEEIQGEGNKVVGLQDDKKSQEIPKPVINTPEPEIPAQKASNIDLISKLAEMKLQGSMIMPKKGEEVESIVKLQGSENVFQSSVKMVDEPITETAPETPVTPQPKSPATPQTNTTTPKIDPYREQI